MTDATARYDDPYSDRDRTDTPNPAAARRAELFTVGAIVAAITVLFWRFGGSCCRSGAERDELRGDEPSQEETA